MSAITLVKMAGGTAECTKTGHVCDFINEMTSKLLSTDLPLSAVFNGVKAERAASEVKAQFGGMLPVRDSDTVQAQVVGGPKSSSIVLG